MIQPVVLAEVKLELQDAVAFYEAEEPGLGLDFWDEFDACVERVCDNPQAYTVIEAQVRRAVMRRFPYGIIYQLRGSNLFVLCLMHLRRHPDSWRGRL